MDRFDRWALRRARSGATDFDRRDLLRRAGVVGAVVAVSPLIQSVSSPALAASCTDPVDAARGCGATCSQKCGTASVCVTPQDCASGVCSAGRCKVDYFAPCEGATVEERDQNCASGYCNYAHQCTGVNTMKQAGASCHAAPPATTATQCDNTNLLVCDSPTNGVCKGAVGARCTKDSDCISGNCPESTGPFHICAAAPAA